VVGDLVGAQAERADVRVVGLAGGHVGALIGLSADVAREVLAVAKMTLVTTEP
jgi:hypothetical protein